MTRKMLAISLILARNMAVATEVSPTWGILLAKLWKEWEVPVLVLLSLALQVILMLFGDRRKRTRSKVIRFFIWSAYMAADSVAIFALGVISSNLHEALVIGGSLSASIEVTSFWAPFLLVHLGGQDTITAYALQDNELWLRHFVYLNVELGLAIYIFSRALKGSRLSILSAMMLVAGAIKYAERTWSLWSASYSRRRYLAQRVQSDYKPLPQNQSPEELVASLFKTKNDEELPASPSKKRKKNYEELLAFLLKTKNYEELLATKMFQQTECMFADALLQVDQKNRSCMMVVQKASSPVVSKLIEMELDLMYENLYTKANLTHSWSGFAFRFISFLLISITLISFSISALHHRYDYSPVQLSVTFVLLGVAILLEGYAAFVFLTSCRTISWLKKHGMHTMLRAMKCLSSLRSASWSNSMGQYSLIRRSLGQMPMMRPFSKDMELRITAFMKDDKVLLYVYDCKVKEYVKEGIYQYLKQAGDMYRREAEEMYGSEIDNLFIEGNFSIFNSKGRVPLRKWIRLRAVKGPSVDNLATLLMFEMEYGEMVILWHIVTEVCYYHDYGSLIEWKDKVDPPQVYWDWKISKNLSRYLMQLFVVSSGMLPPRGPLSEKKFYDEWESIFNPNNSTGETANLHDQQEKLPWGRRDKVQQQNERRRRRARVMACKQFWDRIEGRHNEKNILILDEEEFRDLMEGRNTEGNRVLQAALGFLKVLLNEDSSPANEDSSPANPSLVNNKTKCDLKWELLKEVWIELLVNAANFSKESQHAQHLSEGGEFLTHTWVLLGHLGLTDPRRWW